LQSDCFFILAVESPGSFWSIPVQSVDQLCLHGRDSDHDISAPGENALPNNDSDAETIVRKAGFPKQARDGKTAAR
jgi:hypothetical protein